MGGGGWGGGSKRWERRGQALPRQIETYRQNAVLMQQQEIAEPECRPCITHVGRTSREPLATVHGG